MATEKQVEANRRNALSSTGPKTEDGKRRTRWNSYKHGLAGSGRLMPPDEQYEINVRMETWRLKFGGRAADIVLLRQLANESIKLERAQELTRAYLGNLVDRSQGSWGLLRREAIERLGAELHAAPGLVGSKLGSTAYGCEWLLGRWSGLLEALEANGSWNQVQCSLALDLLGVPLEFREGKTMIDCPSPEVSLLDHRRALVASEIERFKVAVQDLIGHEEDERERYGLGLIWETDPTLDRLTRYESDAKRMFKWAYQKLENDVRDRERRIRENRPLPIDALADSAPSLPEVAADRDLRPLTSEERQVVEEEIAGLLGRDVVTSKSSNVVTDRPSPLAPKARTFGAPNGRFGAEPEIHAFSVGLNPSRSRNEPNFPTTPAPNRTDPDVS